MTHVRNVLILCTGNSARSILAEALINREGAGRFKAYSAGSQPKGEPNPVGLELLRARGFDVSDVRSKSWNEFAGPDAPAMDLIITVCDSAAGEACPLWPGQPMVAHWGIPDPAGAGETRSDERAAFEVAYNRLRARVQAMVALPVDALSDESFLSALRSIGQLEGATERAKSSDPV